jgi:hypothetical protein
LTAKVKTTGQFGPKTFFKIEVTKDGTKAIADGKEIVLKKGQVCGLDKKGYLGSFEQVEEGREIFARYRGTEEEIATANDDTWEPKKKGQSPAHVFLVAAVPV